MIQSYLFVYFNIIIYGGMLKGHRRTYQTKGCFELEISVLWWMRGVFFAIVVVSK